MPTSATGKIALRIVGTIGAGIFGTFLAFTFWIPGWVEDFAAGFIEREVEKRVDRSIDDWQPAARGSALGRFAEALYEKNQAQIDRLKANLKDGVHERMASAIAQIRDLDCECRDKWAASIREGLESDIASLQAANDEIVDFIHRQYMQVATELTKDIRTFTASNLGVFLLLLLASFMKPKAVTHLFLPALLLVVSTALCSYFYVFGQDWLLTIIYSDYLGVTYLAYLLIAFLLLCDIVLNRARVTTGIINGILNALGSALSVSPC